MAKELSSAPATADAGPSNVEIKVKKPKRMIDGREETKEERRARKAAKREAKADATITQTDAPGSSATAEPALTESASSKKDKKRKRDRDADGRSTSTPKESAGVNEQPEEGDEEAPQPTKKSMKKKNNRPPAPEPVKKEYRSDLAEDASLKEAAKKALQYVHEHAVAHLATGTAPDPGKGWKFNKANQNWLIRNVWDESEVPEKYLNEVLGYLKTVQGGARKNLIDLAKKYASDELSVVEGEATETMDGDAVETKEIGTDEKAKVTAPETAASTSEETKRKREVLRSRGEILVKAFDA